MDQLTESKFNYSQLQPEMANFLREKETNMKEIVGSAYTRIGKELKEAKDQLAGDNQYNGYFQKWYESLGFKKDKVYGLINRYELIVGNKKYKRLIENLPLSLTYEMAKDSADPELNQLVLDGDITSHKEYISLKNDKNLKNDNTADDPSRNISSVVKKKLYLNSKGQCYVCGLNGPEISSVFEIHHKIPFSISGDNSLNNLVLVCPICHKIIHNEFINVNDLVTYSKEEKNTLIKLKSYLTFKERKIS